MDNEQEDIDKLLVEAHAALANAPVPTGPSDALLDRTHDALRDLPTAGTTTRSKPSRGNVASFRNVAAVAAALLAIFVLTHLLWPEGSSGSFAFADVQAQVARTKSVQYVETRTNRLKEGRKIDGMVRRVKVLGAYRMREELTETPGDDNANSQNVDAYVQIHDANKGILLTLYPDKKAYQYVKRILGISDDGKLVESKPEPNPQIDFYAQIRDVPSEKTVKLTDKFVNGRAARGFEVVQEVATHGGTDTWTRRYWVDPATQFPVQTEVSYRSTMPGECESDWVQSDIVFDEPLDEALFSTDPPPGYKDLAAEATRPE